MYEIEAKVPITPSDFSRLRKQLKKEAEFDGKYLKKDVYYEDPKKTFIRIRQKNKKIFFNIKNKGVNNGIESNLEIEWGIKNMSDWHNFLKKIGIKPSMKKIKKTASYKIKDIKIELNYIEKLGYFLEIERIVRLKKDIPKAKKELIDIFKRFGYSQKAFEKRYYLELLKNLKT